MLVDVLVCGRVGKIGDDTKRKSGIAQQRHRNQ